MSNDGIPQEFDAIRKGEIDATVSQPADLYAKYGIMYLKDAIEGKRSRPGRPTTTARFSKWLPAFSKTSSRRSWSPRPMSTTSRFGETIPNSLP